MAVWRHGRSNGGDISKWQRESWTWSRATSASDVHEVFPDASVFRGSTSEIGLKVSEDKLAKVPPTSLAVPPPDPLNIKPLESGSPVPVISLNQNVNHNIDDWGAGKQEGERTLARYRSLNVGIVVAGMLTLAVIVALYRPEALPEIIGLFGTLAAILTGIGIFTGKNKK